MVDFRDFEEARRWFNSQQYEVSVTIATRAALRVLPLIQYSGDLLPCFRATAVSWAASRCLGDREELQAIAQLAQRAVLFGYTQLPKEAAAGTTEAAATSAVRASANAAETAGAATRRATTNGAANAVFLAANAVAYAAAAYEGRAGYAGTEAAIRLTAANAAAHAGEVADAAANADVGFIERASFLRRTRAKLASEVAAFPIWAASMPAPIREAWNQLKSVLVAANEGWEVWTDWYEDRLAGRASDPNLELARATLPDELWKEGPKAVNAEIRRLIEAHTPPEPIPAQGAGPHFALSPAHRIGLAAASDIDAAGNNLGRLRQQLPLVREAADDFAGRLNPNAFPEMARNLVAYRAAIEGEPEAIAWGVVFGRGVRLDNAAAAARRQIEDRLQPPLEDAAREGLESVLILHGPMILATAEGRELMDDAGRMLLTREQQAALRTDALAVAMALNDDKNVIEPSAAEIVMEAVETIGEGPHPERGSVVGGAAIRNVMIWAVGIGAIAAIAGVGFVQAGAAVIAIEGLKKSKRFSALTDAFGARIDGVMRTGAAFQNFVIRNEQPLRQMASNSAGMRWMLPYIDDVVRRNAEEHRAKGAN